MLQFTDNTLGNALVIAAKGRIDNTTANLFEAHCSKALADGAKNVILDFEDLQFLSSAGLRGILLLAKRLKANGGKLVFCGIGDAIREIFEIAGFDEMFPIYANLEAATAEAV